MEGVSRWNVMDTVPSPVPRAMGPPISPLAVVDGIDHKLVGGTQQHEAVHKYKNLHTRIAVDS